MSRLKKYAKKSKEEYHQYPWKVDHELFAFFSKYCESLNLSVNEGLSLLVGDEIEAFRQELSEAERADIVEELRRKKRNFLPEGLPPSCIHPGMPLGGRPPGDMRQRRGPDDMHRGGPRRPVPDNE